MSEAAEIAFTEDEARAFTQRGNLGTPAHLKTAESIGAGLRVFYRFCLTQWE
ncbi:unnamed protein product [Gemmata massiliana]|uniref:Uncharacterized protein n=1 Tax=Gemmata massiliana TaxID=1210884 RepID=A0A6P2D7M9_9BACT|nr:hypothetical protein [Gemmata massiliana]VTR96993.1 unnamed protein product [Gemmata massiliana]